MGRKFDKNASSEVIDLLDKLVDQGTEHKAYAQTMYQLGQKFGPLILERISPSIKEITLACTVEDADYLGQGIVDFLEAHQKKILLTVFWNKRFNPNKENGIAIAPIIKEFHEEGYQKVATMIVIKSIISSSCVVRTNLTRLIEHSVPNQILIVAPVLLQGAIGSLESEFEVGIKDKFNYLFFAEDDQKSNDGNVLPGIGGDVYERLGFTDQIKKNRFTPEIVKRRRIK